MKSLLRVSLTLAGGVIIWSGTSAWAQRVRIPTNPGTLPNSTEKIQTSPALKDGISLDVATQLALLQSSVKELQKENADLKKRLSAVETQSAQSTKDMVAVKLLLPALDKAIGTSNSNLTEFKAEFKAHRHGLTTSLISFHDLQATDQLGKQRLLSVYYVKPPAGSPGDFLTPMKALQKTEGFQRTTGPVPPRNP